MKTVRRLWAMGLLVGTLGWSLAQTPTLILTNGDVNGDSTIDDADLLAVLFVMGQSCPSGCPEDLNGDGSVDDADLLITMFNQGQQGASASGVFRVSLTVRLGDWSGADQSVKVQVKPVGSENDPNVPIYEYTFSVGGSDTQVELTNLPVGVYTVRAFPADAGRWLRTEQSEPLAVPDGGGIPAVHVPAPAWAQEVIPADSVPAAGLGGGPSRAHRVNLASGVYEHTPEPDLVVINPVGPEVRFARFYSTHLARQGYASAGLPVGWIHSYDLRLEGDLNRLTLRYPNGAEEILTPRQVGTNWFLEPPAGAPYRGIGARNQAQGRWERVRLHFQDGSAWEFEYVSGQRYRLTRVYGRGSTYTDINTPPPSSGLFLRLEYDTEGRLSRLLSSTGAVLLRLNYTGSYLQSVVAFPQNPAHQATVYYTVQNVQGVPCLTAISQINNSSAFLWRFEYTVRGGVPYLTRVETPHPSGAGLSVAQIAYGANGAVVMLIDGNGNVRTYRYHGTRTDVKAYGANGSLDSEWTQKIGNANVSAGIQDAQNAQSQLVYENTYRPIQYTNRNNQTITMTRDVWGNPLTIITPRGIQWQLTYNYPANYPIEPLISMTVTQQGSDGSVRTPTVYEFYQTTNISQGAVRGLVSRILSPRPGTAGTGEQVETHFYYTALGNVAMISAPGANNDGRRWTTVFFYTIDPWGGGPFTERQNQPVAVAVYDKTLTLADYASIPSNPALRDDRLVFFERYRYDDRGNLIAIQDAAGFTTTLSYNRSDQLEEIVYPTDSLNGVQARERFLYRYVGGPLYAAEVYNATTRVRSYSIGLGAEGEIRGTEVAGERKADIGYDSQYRLRSTQGGRNATTGQRHTTEYTYTAQNFPQQTRYPNGDTYTLTEHDNEGNPLRRLDAQGLITLYIRALSIDSRLEEVQYPDNTGNLRFEYDGFNRVQRLTRLVPDLNSAIVVEYSYDDNDLITSVRTTYPGLPPREVSYTYYPDGSRASMTVAGSQFTYEYTFLTGTLRVSGEPFAGMRVRVNLPVPTGLRLDSWYDRRGLLRMEETTNGVYREYHYNGRGLLTHLYNRYRLGSDVSNRYADFTNLLYDAVGNLLQMNVSIPAFGGAPALTGTVVYGYDLQDRQIAETAPWYSVNFSYDSNDNPTLMRGASFTSNAADQISNSGWAYQNGDAVEIVRFGEGLILTYNREHQLVRYYNPNAAPPIDIQYFYRPDGLLAGRIGPNYFRWYLYDGDLLVAEVDGNTGSLVLLYAYGPEGLTQRFAPDGTNRRLYTFDPFGNVVHRVQFGQSYPNVLSVAWHDRLGATYIDRSSTGVDPFPTPDVLDGYLARYGLFRDPWTRPWNQANLTSLITTSWGTAFDPATGRFTSRAGGSQNPYTRLYRPEKNFADANWNLVVSFAAWGYTVGDPSASEGEKFLAGLSALGRLLAVGSEWGGYAAAPAVGGGARRIAREATEEAGEQLVRQTARNAIPRRVARAIRLQSLGEAKKAEEGILPDWLTHLGRPGSPDAFVTAPADIRRIKTARGLAKRLTLLNNGSLQSGPYIVLEFDTPWGIASPINRSHPGFVGFGRTAGGAREWVVPNLPLSALRNLDWRVVY